MRNFTVLTGYPTIPTSDEGSLTFSFTTNFLPSCSTVIFNNYRFWNWPTASCLSQGVCCWSRIEPREMKTELFDLVSTSRWPLIIQSTDVFRVQPVSLLFWASIIPGFILGLRLYQAYRHSTKPPVSSQAIAPTFAKIEPIKDFNLNSTKPPVFRPFKPKYHLTMGMSPCADAS